MWIDVKRCIIGNSLSISLAAATIHFRLGQRENRYDQFFVISVYHVLYSDPKAFERCLSGATEPVRKRRS